MSFFFYLSQRKKIVTFFSLRLPVKFFSTAKFSLPFFSVFFLSPYFPLFPSILFIYFFLRYLFDIFKRTEQREREKISKPVRGKECIERKEKDSRSSNNFPQLFFSFFFFWRKKNLSSANYE